MKATWPRAGRAAATPKVHKPQSGVQEKRQCLWNEPLLQLPMTGSLAAWHPGPLGRSVQVKGGEHRTARHWKAKCRDSGDSSLGWKRGEALTPETSPLGCVYFFLKR